MIDFESIAFSIFQVGAEAFNDCVEAEFSSELGKGEARLVPFSEDIQGTEFTHLMAGSAHNPKFIFAPLMNRTAYISNYGDGWMTLVNVLSARLGCGVISVCVSMSPGSELYWYQKIRQGETQRIVYVLKDDIWEFFEKGDPLPYEILENYSRRLKKERLPLEAIIGYLKAEGIDLEEIFQQKVTGTLLEMLKWGSK